MRPSLLVPTALLALVSPASASSAVEFARDVQPILQRACAVCHNETAAQGGLSLSSRSAIPFSVT